MYLRQALPRELDYLMVGVREMGVAWQRLEDRYGDVQLQVRALYDHLATVDLRGKEYERLERLHFEVENSSQMALQLGQGEMFGNDLYVVAALLAKLSAQSVDKWIEYAEAWAEPVVTGRNEWTVFRKWLAVCYKKAKRARLTAATAPRPGVVPPANKVVPPSTATSKTTLVCSRCKESGHRRENCPLPSTASGINNVDLEYEHMCDRAQAFATDAERVTAFKDAERRFGKCPLCRNAHTYQRKMGNENVTWPSGRFSSCPLFEAMNPAEKGKALEDKKGCIRCLAWTHQRPVCPKKGRPCQEKVNGTYCNKSHDTALHDSGSRYCEAAHVHAQACTGQEEE